MEKLQQKLTIETHTHTSLVAGALTSVKQSRELNLAMIPGKCP